MSVRQARLCLADISIFAFFLEKVTMGEKVGQMFESVEIVFSESGSSELVMDRKLLPKPIIQLGHPLGNELAKWKLVPLVPKKKPFPPRQNKNRWDKS